MVNEHNPSKGVKDIMEKCSKRNFVITGVLYTLYIIGATSFLLYPIFMFVIFQMKEPWLPIFVPGIDYNTRAGFVVTSIYHYVVLYMAGIVYGFWDSLFSNLVFNVLTMAKLQCNQLLTLNEEVSNAKTRKSMIQLRLTNFFLMNKEMQK